MLTLCAGRAECLWDETLPVGVRELPQDLAALDLLLSGAGRVEGPQACLQVRPETVSELTRTLIARAMREKRFRPRAVRIDSTVVEADVKYPSDAGLASHGVRALAREGRKLAQRIGESRRRVRDCSRAMGRRLRGITRTIRARSGEAKAQVLKPHGADRRVVGALGARCPDAEQVIELAPKLWVVLPAFS
jgi:hypothetical protein